MKLFNATKNHLTFAKIVFLLTCVATLLVSMIPTQTEAATNNNYGPWFAKPKKHGSAAGFQANVQPFNDNNTAEMLSFACVMKDGTQLENDYDSSKLLAEINRYATKVYAGKLESNDFAKDDSGVKMLPNMGFPNGKKGMRKWLKLMQTALKDGNKDMAVIYSLKKNMSIVKSSDQDNSAYLMPAGDDEKYGFKWDYKDFNLGNLIPIKIKKVGPIPIGIDLGPDSPFADKLKAAGINPDDFRKSRRRLADNMLNPNANNPLQLLDNIPDGCMVSVIDGSTEVGFKDLLAGNIGEVVMDLILTPFAQVSEMSFNFFAPLAFKYSFWTPHSERGDLMWSVAASCDNKTVTDFSARGVNRYKKGDYCTSNFQPLGFSKSRTNLNKQTSVYLNIARFLQWLVSGLYFLIIFTSAVMFIARGNRPGSAMNAFTVIPRIIIAVLLTVFSTFLIGAVISFANFLVLSIYNEGGSSSIQVINVVLQLAGPIIGADDIFQKFFSTVVTSMATWMLFMFLITAVFRQIVLLLLIVVAPLAFFSIVSPNWERNFARWWKALIGVAFIPVIAAFVLKISIMVNPLTLNPQGAFGNPIQGLIGIVIILAGLWGVVKVFRMGREFIFDQANKKHGLMRLASGARHRKKLRGRMNKKVGAGTQNALNAASGTGSAFIPDGRGIEGGGGPSVGTGGPGGSPGSGGGSRPGSGSGGGAPVSTAGNSAGQGIKNWQDKRRAMNGKEVDAGAGGLPSGAKKTPGPNRNLSPDQKAKVGNKIAQFAGSKTGKAVMIGGAVVGTVLTAGTAAPVAAGVVGATTTAGTAAAGTAAAGTAAATAGTAAAGTAAAGTAAATTGAATAGTAAAGTAAATTGTAAATTGAASAGAGSATTASGLIIPSGSTANAINASQAAAKTSQAAAKAADATAKAEKIAKAEKAAKNIKRAKDGLDIAKGIEEVRTERARRRAIED